jgi:thioredoxin-dependent peroxiredoxin
MTGMTPRGVKLFIIADADRNVSELYELIHPNASVTATVRSHLRITPQPICIDEIKSIP